MAESVEEHIATIREACRREPIDWDSIRGASLSLGGAASTDEQQLAVDALGNASDRHGVERAVSDVERAFFDGKPGVDGWPRRF